MKLNCQQYSAVTQFHLGFPIAKYHFFIIKFMESIIVILRLSTSNSFFHFVVGFEPAYDLLMKFLSTLIMDGSVCHTTFFKAVFEVPHMLYHGFLLPKFCIWNPCGVYFNPDCVYIIISGLCPLWSYAQLNMLFF